MTSGPNRNRTGAPRSPGVRGPKKTGRSPTIAPSARKSREGNRPIPIWSGDKTKPRGTTHALAGGSAPHRGRHHRLHRPHQPVCCAPRDSHEFPALSGIVGNSAVGLFLGLHLAANAGRMGSRPLRPQVALRRRDVRMERGFRRDRVGKLAPRPDCPSHRAGHWRGHRRSRPACVISAKTLPSASAVCPWAFLCPGPSTDRPSGRRLLPISSWASDGDGCSF